MSKSDRRILVADDEVVVRLLVERLFARRGEHATVVASATEAIEAIEAMDDGGFDVVVSDIRMPGGGGAAVARAAIQRGLPILFITGFADSGDVQEFLDQGIRVVRKPFTPDQLLQAIDEVLAGEADAG